MGWGWRDMAFDRAYVGPDRVDTLYASCDFNVDRFGINKTTGTLDYYGPLPGPINPNRPLAYMPESLYFFTADMFHIYKFIKNGSFVDLDTTPWVLRGAAYDHDILGGGSVWWSSLDSVEQFKMYDPNAMYFTGISFGSDYPGSGLGFAQNFRNMDVLFSVMNLPQEDYIYGFFLRWSDSTGVAENHSLSKQAGFGFALNMPNPIRKGTPISYFLPCKYSARLCVYDATGRLVKTLFNSTKLAGNHIVVWDCQDCSGRILPSGVYFLKLEANQNLDIRKIVYIE
ncbi:MAG: FlgD immunoglobulin-like domain containing protein, partial [bacterium]